MSNWWKSLWNFDHKSHKYRKRNNEQRLAVEALEERQVLSSISVLPGIDTLLQAVASARNGDTLKLKPGLYLVSETVEIDKNLTIKGTSSKAENVRIAPVQEDANGDNGFDEGAPGTGGHILFVKSVKSATFANFTVQGGTNFELTERQIEKRFDPVKLHPKEWLNAPEYNGDGIHVENVDALKVTNVRATLNGGNGIYIIGVKSAVLTDIVGSNNGSFGIDVDTAQSLIIDRSTFIGNGISGLEASGHDRTNITFTATVMITNTVALQNGEIGIEVERFKKATLKNVDCSENLEDGFDADRVYVVEIADSTFSNNLDEGLELFPIGVPVYPDDFQFDIIEKFKNLKIFGNRGLPIDHPPTED